MVLYADPTHDGRVQREARSLASEGLDVTILALQDPRALDIPSTPGVEVLARRPGASRVLPGTKSPFHPGDPGTLPPVRGGRLGWFLGYGANLRAWGRWAVRAGGRPDVWHVHDFTGILALWLGGLPRRAPLVYDSHELYMELGSAARMPAPVRRGLATIEGRMARRARGVITVNQGVAGELARRYGVDPVVVLNCPPYTEVDVPGSLRSTLRLEGRQVLLYHGAVSEGRGIEQTVAALPHLPASTVFVVLGNGALVPWLREQQRRPELAGRIALHPAVPLSELLSWVVDADLGLSLIAPTELNFVLSTPNKLFECIVAGVPVLASDFPEMRRIVIGEDIGAVCDPMDPTAIAGAIRELLADPARLAQMRAKARAAARARYNWDAQAEGLLALYRRILAPPSSSAAR
jgi:glycosyltransferase involved in cell wall biosynthesis